MGVALVLTLAAMTTGLSAFSILLGQAGEPLLAALALGCFLMGGFSFLVATLLQVGTSGVAARVWGETGTTPGWLEPMWIAASWAEMSYIMLSSLAYVAWGVGVVNSGFSAKWPDGRAWPSVGCL